MREVLLNPPLGDFLKLVAVNAAFPDRGLVLLGKRVVGVPFVPAERHVVIRPHEIELHPVVIARLEETVIQMALEKRHAIVPIPIEDEDIHSVVCRGIDLHLGHIRIGFVDIAPERVARLLVPLELGFVADNGLPFPDPIRPEYLRAVVGMIGRPDKSGDVVTLAGRRWRILSVDKGCCDADANGRHDDAFQAIAEVHGCCSPFVVGGAQSLRASESSSSWPVTGL